jgi:ribonuclease-3
MPKRSAPLGTRSSTSTSELPSAVRPASATGPVGPAAALAERLGLPVRDLELLEQALVHSSWLHEHREAARGHNERLEFLGDVVVNLAISEALYEAHPSDDEGLLSTRRASIVSTTGLARLAGRIDLGALILLGEGEAQRGGRRRPSLLASAFEAVAGALYIDLGWERTRLWLVDLAEPELSNDSPGVSLKSPKSRLQEHTQRRTGLRPEYRIVAASGPDHEKLFRIEVWIDGRPLGVGEGPSRRTAETAAATRALEELRRERTAASSTAAAVAGESDAAAPTATTGTTTAIAAIDDELPEISTPEPAVASRTRATSRRTPG